MHRISITALVSLTIGCSADRAIYSDPGDEGNLASVLDSDPDEPTSGLDGDDGPSCPPRPEGRPLMPDLAVGWAVETADTVRLQLGTHAFACGSAIDEQYARADACPAAWAFEIAIDPEALVPGELELGPEHTGIVVQLERSPDGRGCARETVRSSSQGFSGTLRIHAVSDTCIVGEFVDLDFPTDDLADLSGVFLAERC